MSEMWMWLTEWQRPLQLIELDDQDPDSLCQKNKYYLISWMLPEMKE